ncbi:MAG: hypothetical protein D3915_11075 [Candidatus Electrothrix sp. AU1_5]|nr:hypothetical protein [Candidatus Electrothrix gigas]
MNPIITSITGLIATLTGACAMLLMLELRGNLHKESKVKQHLVTAHKVTGYIFIALFLVILVVMFSKAGAYQGEFSPRTILHISLALLIIPLLFFKILIIRRFKRFERKIPGIGLAIFMAVFLLNSMTAGYYFLQWSRIGNLSLSQEDRAVLKEQKGQKLVVQKCQKCHTLERIFKALKTEQGWTETVNRMVSFDATHITQEQGKQILDYLINQQTRREKLAATTLTAKEQIGKHVLEKKCSFCHGLDRIYLAKKTQEEWSKLVDTMIHYAKQKDFLNPQEKEAVLEFLSSRAVSQTENENNRGNSL